MTLTFNIWPWKYTEFQILLRTKYVPSLVKIYWRILILECSKGCYGRTNDGRKDGRKGGRTDGSVTISLRNFVGEGIISVPTLIGRQSHELIIHLQNGLWFVFWAFNTTFNIPGFIRRVQLWVYIVHIETGGIRTYADVSK